MDKGELVSILRDGPLRGPPQDEAGGFVYFTRFQLTLAAPPPFDGVGLTYIMSSPANERIRVWVPPEKLGNEQPSILTVSTAVASSIAQLPKLAIMPCMTALFSSGVPVMRLLEANIGRSERSTMIMKRLLAPSISEPIGLRPYGMV